MATRYNQVLKRNRDKITGAVQPSGVYTTTADNLGSPATRWNVIAGNKALNVVDGGSSEVVASSSRTSNQNRYTDLLNSREARDAWLADRGYDSKGYPLNSSTTNVTATPTYEQPYAIRNYDWGDGSQYLTPDNPLVRPVVYQNEFSPESTMSIASDVYNEYYAPIVNEQQRQTTQEYRNTAEEAAATAGAAGMATGSRGAVQLMNQANREATAANLQYQQQMQLQAFQDTLNARQLELENKIQDYQNAWQEVSQYGYVVTENTGNLLGIEPGQQLTTYAYKQAMSDIARNVADINAQKVTLNQQQQQLDQNWAQFQESIRQYEKDFAENQRQFDMSYELESQQVDSTIYSRLVDMLGRYNTVTPEMASLGRQVGMNLTVGSSTSNYLTEAERLANNQAIYGKVEGAGTQYYYDQYQLQQLANSYLPAIQGSGKIGNASQFAAVLAQWKSMGVSPNQAANYIKDKNYEISGMNLRDVIGNVSGSRDAATAIAYQVLGGTQSQYNAYQTSNTLDSLSDMLLAGSALLPGTFGIPYNLLNSYRIMNGY